MSARDVTFGIKTRTAFVIAQVMATVENRPSGIVKVFGQSGRADEHDDRFRCEIVDADQTATESNTVTRSQRCEQSAMNFW